MTIVIEGVVKERIDKLVIGQRVDLECDSFADIESNGHNDSPFAYEFEIVMLITQETPDCIRIDFESGFSCGFPPKHLVNIDGEQILADNKESAA